jgi:hypothetical protein
MLTDLILETQAHTLERFLSDWMGACGCPKL